MNNALENWFKQILTAMEDFIPKKKQFKTIPHPRPSPAHIAIKNQLNIIKVQGDALGWSRPLRQQLSRVKGQLFELLKEEQRPMGKSC